MIRRKGFVHGTYDNGHAGAAVEDVQSRLLQLGYTIDDAEVSDKRFGTTTEQAVGTFRLDSGLAAGCAVDIPVGAPW